MRAASELLFRWLKQPSDTARPLAAYRCILRGAWPWAWAWARVRERSPSGDGASVTHPPSRSVVLQLFAPERCTIRSMKSDLGSAGPTGQGAGKPLGSSRHAPHGAAVPQPNRLQPKGPRLELCGFDVANARETALDERLHSVPLDGYQLHVAPKRGGHGLRKRRLETSRQPVHLDLYRLANT